MNQDDDDDGRKNNNLVVLVFVIVLAFLLWQCSTSQSAVQIKRDMQKQMNTFTK